MIHSTSLSMPDELLARLNTVQREAVQTTQGPVLILAGAGSGKTRVLTHRIAYLIAEENISPFYILAVTFTNKAAHEMKERIIALVGEEATKVWMGTFHSVFSKILRMEAEKIGLTRNYTIYDSDDQRALIKQCMQEQNISTEVYPIPLIHSRISYAKNHLLSPSQFLKSVDNPIDERAQKIYASYEKQLQRQNALDFDDLIMKPILLFNNHPQVLDFYQNKFRYIHVDEYQDTNHAQYQLIRLLAEKHRNICVVGDDDQSIYGWRHADITNILNFTREFPDTSVFKLEQNYRSTKRILKAAGHVVVHNRMRNDKTLWTDNPTGEPVSVIENENDRDEARCVVRLLQERVQRERRVFSDFAILYRTNAQSRLIEEALRTAVIPYVIIGGLRFYERKEIKDVLAYLRVIVNPADDVSFRRILNFPPRGIGATTIEFIENYAQTNYLSLHESVFRLSVPPEAILTSRAKNALMAFYELIEKYRQLLGTMNPGEWLGALLEETGILRYYKKSGTVEDEERYENIAELINAVQEFIQRQSYETPAEAIEAFLNDVTLMTDVDQWDNRRNVVTLMTLHSSKGLEFPVVFIVGLEEGLFPIARATEDLKELEEERRLFYVGATRAKEKLYLLHARQRMRFNNLYLCQPSRFLSELPEDEIEEMDFSSILMKPSLSRRSQNLPNDGILKRNKTVEEPQPVSRRFRIGQQVHHPTYGQGKIIQVEGHGDQQKLNIRFQDGEERKFYVKYTNLSVY